MAIITTVEELFAINKAMDTEAGTLRDKVSDAHLTSHHDLSGWSDSDTPGPGSRFPHPLHTLGPKPVSTGECLECGEPEFRVLDSKSGKTSEWCRGCINAVRRQSIQHHQYTDEICWNCEITYDSVGLISGVNHHVFPLEDQTLADGSTRRGIGDYLRAGRIDCTDGALTIRDA